ncbi:hypothetical protein ABZ638_04215 [Streptomyces sp. NPDC007107]|uniref:hypothetical protein n=1 Tax=Streptomyces sp. NPDC007107 TaxID=3156915 RepID=UPI0033C91037
MTPSRDTPSPRRRPWYRSAPTGSRTFVLGMCMAVGGIAGAVRGAMEGARLLETAGLLGLGLLGVLLTVAWVLNYSTKR